MGATATRMTVEEYYAITVEGDRKQLVDGAIVVYERMLIHAKLQLRLVVALHGWAEAEPGRGEVLLPTDVVVDEHNLFAPDVLWIAERNRPSELPEICVEIRSLGTWRYDVGAKKAAYERGGLPELWLVDDASESVLVFRRSRPDAPSFDIALERAAGDEITSPQLPGFALSIDELFDV